MVGAIRTNESAQSTCTCKCCNQRLHTVITRLINTDKLIVVCVASNDGAKTDLNIKYPADYQVELGRMVIFTFKHLASKTNELLNVCCMGVLQFMFLPVHFETFCLL